MPADPHPRMTHPHSGRRDRHHRRGPALIAVAASMLLGLSVCRGLAAQSPDSRTRGRHNHAENPGSRAGNPGSQGQDPDSRITDPNGHPFRTPAGSPLDPIHRVAIIGIDLDGERRQVVQTDLGDRLGFWIRRDPAGGPELAGAVHAGAFSRFDLEGPKNAFLEIHYRVGFLLRARIGAWAARAELYHISSHLGDEFLVSTGREPISTSREGVEILVQTSPLAGVMVYGGPGVILRSSQGFETPSVRWGAEWEHPGSAAVRPYVSADFFSWAELDWDPSMTFEAGTALGRRVRLGLLLGFGPSRAEQFFADKDTVIGVSISYLR